jgi:hypothetical protein
LSFNVEQPVQERNGWVLAAGLFAAVHRQGFSAVNWEWRL